LWHLLSSQSKTGKTWKRKGQEVGTVERKLSRTGGNGNLWNGNKQVQMPFLDD
jgi:hypothetical protein